MKNLLATLIVLFPFFAFSQGHDAVDITNSFSIGLGSRAIGMGGAFISIADDCTATFWNPAGLAQLIRPELSLSSGLANGKIYYNAYTRKYIDDNNYYSKYYYYPDTDENSGFNFDFLAFAIPLKSKFNLVIEGSYQKNIGVQHDFHDTYNYTYEDYYKGKLYSQGDSHADYTVNYKKNGYSLLSLSIAGKPLNNVYFGLSVNKWGNGYSYIDENSDSSYINNYDRSTSGINFHIGALIKIKKISFGLSLKTPFKLKNTYTNDNIYENSYKDDYYYSGTYQVKWPLALGLGVSFQPNYRTTIAINYIYTNWADAVSENYNVHTKIVSPSGATKREYDSTYSETRPFPLGSDYNQLDTHQIRFGVEYLVMLNKNVIPLRAGLFTNPLPSRKNRDIGGQNVLKGFSLGSGINFKNFSIDVSYNLITGNIPYPAYTIIDFRPSPDTYTYEQYEDNKSTNSELKLSLIIKL